MVKHHSDFIRFHKLEDAEMNIIRLGTSDYEKFAKRLTMAMYTFVAIHHAAFALLPNDFLKVLNRFAQIAYNF